MTGDERAALATDLAERLHTGGDLAILKMQWQGLSIPIVALRHDNGPSDVSWVVQFLGDPHSLGPLANAGFHESAASNDAQQQPCMEAVVPYTSQELLTVIERGAGCLRVTSDYDLSIIDVKTPGERRGFRLPKLLRGRRPRN